MVFFVLKEPLNEFSDFGVRGRLSIWIIHKRFALPERVLVWLNTFGWCETLHVVALKHS